ncbi:MAG TPA: hypothetical protein VFE27_25605 [Acidobacteriaceae bacterium]|nr:hypothetical protein [Acidobacteriaceae bacterium]
MSGRYDAAYEAGLTTAQVDWVAIYGARTITWSFPEQPEPDRLIEGQLVSAGLVTRDQLANFDDSSPAWQKSGRMPRSRSLTVTNPISYYSIFCV